MKTKYIVKAASSTQCLFLVKDVEINGQVVPFGFRHCQYRERQIAKFDKREDAIAAYEEARKHDRANYTPVILETLVEDNPD